MADARGGNTKTKGNGSGRAAWGTLTRGQIIDAASAIVRAEGYEQLTIRALAAQLGVAPMSLYRHVSHKDDLLDEVVDRQLARVWRPRERVEHWRDWLAEAAERLRKLLVRSPAARHVYLSHPVVSPAAIARMEAMMQVLHDAGMDDETARRAYAALQTYTIGFATLEASRAGWKPPADASDLARELATFTTPDQFAEGLRYLLEGITSR